MRTIRHYIDLHARERPTSPYLIAPETGTVLTFAELATEARKLAAFLAAQGLQPGERVGFYCVNGRQTAVIFLGAMYGGFVSVPLNLVSQPSQLEYVLEHSQTRLVFADRENVARLPRSRAEVKLVDVDAATLFELEAAAPAKVPSETDVCLIMYTSGTTGRPKGCVHTHRSVVSGALFVQQAHALTPQDRVLSSLPLYHINGQIVATVGPMVQGGSVVAPHRFSVSQFWELLAEHRCTWFNVVPTILSYLVSSTSLEGKAWDLSRVRFGRSASAPLPPELHRDFERRFGLTIIETFGMTETCAPCFSNPLDPARRKYGSVGLPVGNIARVARADGSQCAAGEVGELMVKGDNVMLAYHDAPEETARTLEPDGWLHTGDLGYRDEEGYYYVTGRLKELIIKGGENIAPREIDDTLYRHPAVLEAAAVGIPDPHYGQDILVAVVLRPGAAASEADLRAFCERELGRYKTPKVFRFLEELPKGPSGKVQRLRLIDRPAP